MLLNLVDFFSPGFMSSKFKLHVGPHVFFLLEEELVKSNNEIIRNTIHLFYIYVNIFIICKVKQNFLNHIDGERIWRIRMTRTTRGSSHRWVIVIGGCMSENFCICMVPTNKSFHIIKKIKIIFIVEIITNILYIIKIIWSF